MHNEMDAFNVDCYEIRIQMKINCKFCKRNTLISILLGRCNVANKCYICKNLMFFNVPESIQLSIKIIVVIFYSSDQQNGKALAKIHLKDVLTKLDLVNV